jgi:two-component system KDP operon response regulator KdpE
MTVAMHLVLIVEDDKASQEVLRVLFEGSGFRVVICEMARLAENDARLHRSDVVLVDLTEPEGGNVAVIQALRSWSSVPIIALSERTAEADRITALEKGADDYIVRPFSAPELIARVRAILRRHVRGDLPMGLLQLGKVSIDLGKRTAHRSDGRDVRLTPLEHRILETLVRYADRIVTHSTLLKEVWGPHRDDSQALRVNIGNLRKKLEEDPSKPRYIVTEAGVGYRLVLNSEGTDGEAE